MKAVNINFQGFFLKCIKERQDKGRTRDGTIHKALFKALLYGISMMSGGSISCLLV